MTREFIVTHTGELINVIERLQEIAKKWRTIVLACDDW